MHLFLLQLRMLGIHIDLYSYFFTSSTRPVLCFTIVLEDVDNIDLCEGSQ
jgi:hypothetical protein